MAGKRGRPKKCLKDKLNDLDPHFVAEVDSYTSDRVKQKIVDLSKYRETVETSQKEDPDLQSARDQVKVLNETYTIPLKANKLKMQYLLQKLSEQGGESEGAGA